MPYQTESLKGRMSPVPVRVIVKHARISTAEEKFTL